jgi:hypothetical protein
LKDFTSEILTVFPNSSNNLPMIEHITCNAFAVSETGKKIKILYLTLKGDDIHSSDLRNQALLNSRGEYIVIFTLDHFPFDSKFLNRVIPHFSDPKVAAVQVGLNYNILILFSLNINVVIQMKAYLLHFNL